MDEAGLRRAFDEVFDQALVYHGYAEHLRDYDLYVYATADPRTGIAPEHLRLRFTHCVRASATTAVPPEVWSRSLDDRLLDHEATLAAGDDLDGYVWGVKWAAFYPGISLVEGSAEAEEWSRRIGIPFHEARVETNGHDLTLVFSDLFVSVVPPGLSAFTVSPD